MTWSGQVRFWAGMPEGFWMPIIVFLYFTSGSLVCRVLSRAHRELPRRGRPNSGLAAAEKEEQLTRMIPTVCRRRPPLVMSGPHCGHGHQHPRTDPHPTTPIPVSPVSCVPPRTRSCTRPHHTCVPPGSVHPRTRSRTRTHLCPGAGCGPNRVVVRDRCARRVEWSSTGPLSSASDRSPLRPPDTDVPRLHGAEDPDSSALTRRCQMRRETSRRAERPSTEL